MKRTIKDSLQELLNETQSEMSTYRQLPEKKKKKRKIMEAYRYLMYRELHLIKAIKKLKRPLSPSEITALYVGDGEPKMEVCEIEEIEK